MPDLLRRPWFFILEKLSTSTLSLLLFSIVIPVIVFGVTSVYAWHGSNGRVPLRQVIAGAFAPTAISIAVTLFALLCLLSWGIVAVLRADYESLKQTISERDTEISRLSVELGKATTGDKQPGKLTVHSAIYGTGNLDDVSVLNKLNTMMKDALVIPVDNSLVDGKDPAPNQPKRLIVEYSYGESPKRVVERPESQPGRPSRLVLPEDSQIGRLTEDLKIVKEAAVSASEARRYLESALAESDNKHREELAKLGAKLDTMARDWAGDWKELSHQFRELSRHQISVNWSRTSAGEHWDVSGDNEARHRIESLCKHCGNLLAASPKVSHNLPSEFLRYPAGDRWLFYLKAKSRAFRMSGYGVEQLGDGKNSNVLLGSITNLADVSANTCMECAGQEY